MVLSLGFHSGTELFREIREENEHELLLGEQSMNLVMAKIANQT